MARPGGHVPGLGLCGPCPPTRQRRHLRPGWRSPSSCSPRRWPFSRNIFHPGRAQGPRHKLHALHPWLRHQHPLLCREQPHSIHQLLPVNCANNDLQNWAEVIGSSLVVKSDSVVIFSQRELSASFLDELTSCIQNMLTIFIVSHLTGVLLKFLVMCKLGETPA